MTAVSGLTTGWLDADLVYARLFVERWRWPSYAAAELRASRNAQALARAEAERSAAARRPVAGDGLRRVHGRRKR